MKSVSKQNLLQITFKNSILAKKTFSFHYSQIATP